MIRYGNVLNYKPILTLPIISKYCNQKFADNGRNTIINIFLLLLIT